MMSLTWTPPRVRDSWRLPFGVLIGLLLLILLAYRETGVAMVGIWMRSETFTHAFVVPPIVAWLIWRKRGELEPLQPRPLPWMLAPMVGLALLWWLGSLVNVASAMQLALVGMLVASVPLVLGWAVTRVLVFPLAFLFFSVPIGEFMTPTLMHWTVEALVAGLRMTGIPVYQEGQQLVIPSGRWAVVAACSGVRYLMATFMVGSLFAYLNYTSTRKRLVFVAISLVLPVLANWVRAYIIVMLGHLSNNEIATGVDHVVYGWVFFGVVILALFFIGARWADSDGTPTASAPGQRPAQPVGAGAAAGWLPLAVAGLALLALQWPHWVPGGRSLAGPVTLQLPEQLGAWRAGPLPQRHWAPFFASATARRQALYEGPQGQVAVHVAYYRGQQGDVKLVSSANRFVEAGDAHWHVLAEGVATVPVGDAALTWRQATVLGQEGLGLAGSGSRQHLTVWRLYWMNGATAHSDVRAKLLQAWQAAIGKPDDGAALHLVSMLTDEAAAQRQLAQFVRENYPMLVRALTQAQAGQ